MDRRGWLNLLLRRVLPALAVLALLAASLKLAEDAAGGATRYVDAYAWVLGAAALALVLLIALIGQRLWRLRRDLGRGAPGARLSRRLLIVLVLLAVPPVVVVYGFAVRFLNATVDSWFDVNLERALDDSLEIGRIVIDEHLRRAENGTHELASELVSVFDRDMQATLDREVEALAATQLTVFDADRRVLAMASSDPRYLDPEYPDATTLIRLSSDGRYVAAEPVGDSLLLRVVIPVGEGATATGRRLLQGLYPLPERLQPLTRRIEDATFDFQRLKYLRGSLKLTFAMILTFVLLLSVLFALLAAFGVARRLLAPVGRLVHATRAVGAGRYDTPLPVASNDELGYLVNSFNQMTRELELAGTRAQRSAQEIETQRAWLGAVLERLSAGVLGFDRSGALRIANRAGEAILGLPLSNWIGRSLVDIRRERPELAAIVDPLARHMREGLREWREEIVVEAAEGRRVLMLRGAALPAEGGFVAVFDDLTVLNSAQRDAAWGEVARRLAHEVKNPLTPIQLAAERLRRRFIGRLAADDSELLDRATHTIVSQVEALKTMVNAFGDYARPPQLNARPIALHALLGEVLDLYANDQRLALTRHLAEGELLVKADPVRLRQALHNLLKNALEAIGEERKPQIQVSTRIERDADGAWVELCVADNGPGLPEGFGERWFEPYTTSKARGTGLGLAVVKKIAEEHGGSVRAENRNGGGAEFRLRLPLEPD
ncbi:MAG TPA: ATP-binding protein [Dokdonella sp.]|uniref:sensor histidine kinase n=1 Tax=Dokdonella sp. TaxID=2291710 RepID=UPI0025B8900D|nr:ATP-binding protein [Dokdonella sp.]MBX3691474.1 HAMP domain-containing protein [Dokdonella sp.]MCW5568565.1 HAMP domain-containing protein [Dokdonella sp.]HNR91792.1 ATP-binding protein [Dokdonella sp.]